MSVMTCDHCDRYVDTDYDVEGVFTADDFVCSWCLENGVLRDGEVLDLDNGTIVQWNAEACEPYNCGEKPDEFGTSSLTAIEYRRLLRAGWPG